MSYVDPPSSRDTNTDKPTGPVELAPPPELEPENKLDAEPVIQTIELRAGYPSRTVLREVSLTIQRGEFWALIGPNGAGKTTLVNTLLGHLPPLGGLLRRHSELGRPKHIGFVPQAADINRTLPTTVSEFVSLGMVNLGLNRQRRSTRLAQAIELVNLKGMVNQDYWTLSEGQRQRALVARALVRDPNVLILDEPTTGLDVKTERVLFQCVSELHRNRKLTVLLVTHDLTLAQQHASHAVLFTGETIETGPSDRMLTEANLARVFNLDPQPT